MSLIQPHQPHYHHRPPKTTHTPRSCLTNPARSQWFTKHIHTQNSNDRRYRDILDFVPKGESLEMCSLRVMQYWEGVRSCAFLCFGCRFFLGCAFVLVVRLFVCLFGLCVCFLVVRFFVCVVVVGRPCRYGVCVYTYICVSRHHQTNPSNVRRTTNPNG